MEREQAKELWSRLVSGEALTAAEETLLLNRLLERPVLRREFVEDATLDSELRCLARLDSPKDDFLQGFAKKLSEDRGLFLFNRFPADGGGPKKRWIAVAVAVLCVTFLPAGIALWSAHLMSMTFPRGAVPWLLKTKTSRVLPWRGTKSIVAPGVAAVTRSFGAVWKSPNEPGGRLSAGSLELLEGMAQIGFDKGTRIVVTGPARFEILSGNELRLDQGKMTVEISVQAAGFVIGTPTARLVEQEQGNHRGSPTGEGCLLDVAVGESGTTETLVRKGRLSLEPRSGGKQAGKTVEVAADGLDRGRSFLPMRPLPSTR